MRKIAVFPVGRPSAILALAILIFLLIQRFEQLVDALTQLCKLGTIIETFNLSG